MYKDHVHLNFETQTEYQVLTKFNFQKFVKWNFVRVNLCLSKNI
jgi:hypothetical protein